MSFNFFWISSLRVAVLLLLFFAPLRGFSELPKPNLHRFGGEQVSKNQSQAYVWLDIALEVTGQEVDRTGARPTILSRTLAIWATSVYEAWSQYDSKALDSFGHVSKKRPKKERTNANKAKAITYASYVSLMAMYPESKSWLSQKMKDLGFNPTLDQLKPNSPESIGYQAAMRVLESRKRDGSNQEGDEIGGDLKPYSDYTYYRPVNSPDKVVDPNRWQPITFTKDSGEKFTPGFLTPHWYRVRPFLLKSSSQFRPEPPPTTKSNDALLKAQTEKILEYNRSLTNEQKALVEFMRDGPRSTGQSGHWLRFAQDVSRRDSYDIDKDVKIYFAVANVAFDAFISCWETKRFYDSSRPWTLVRHYFKNQKVIGWAGKSGGTKEMPAEEWRPYSPETFITPPFPGYTSGHATVSGAAAKIIELFTGTDQFGFIERRPHCELTEKTAGQEVDLGMDTWSQTAEMAAVSRAMGGYHIPIDNDVGLRVGREIAVWSWPYYKAFFEGQPEVLKNR